MPIIMKRLLCSFVAIVLLSTGYSFCFAAEDDCSNYLDYVVYINNNVLNKYDLSKASETIIYSPEAGYKLSSFSINQTGNTYAIVGIKDSTVPHDYSRCLRLYEYDQTSKHARVVIEENASWEGSGYCNFVAQQFIDEGRYLVMGVYGGESGLTGLVDMKQGAMQYLPFTMLIEANDEGIFGEGDSVGWDEQSGYSPESIIIKELAVNGSPVSSKDFGVGFFVSLSRKYNISITRKDNRTIFQKYPSGDVLFTYKGQACVPYCWSSEIVSHCWNPVKAVIASYNVDYYTKVNIINARSGDISVINPNVGEIKCFRWLPDGNGFIVINSNKIGVQQLDTDLKQTTSGVIALPKDDDGYLEGTAVSFSKDHRRILLQLCHEKDHHFYVTLDYVNLDEMKAVRLPIHIDKGKEIAIPAFAEIYWKK